MNGKFANSCKHPQTFSWSLVTLQWMFLCNSKKPGLLNTAVTLCQPLKHGVVSRGKSPHYLELGKHTITLVWVILLFFPFFFSLKQPTPHKCRFVENYLSQSNTCKSTGWSSPWQDPAGGFSGVLSLHFLASSLQQFLKIICPSPLILGTKGA